MTPGDPFAVAGELKLVPILEGLATYALPRTDGTFAADRRGRERPRRVMLRADPPTAPTRPPGLTDADWRWATSSTERHWSGIKTRLVDNAEQTATSLARTGCVALILDYRDGSPQWPPLKWSIHPDLQQAHADRDQARDDQRAAISTRARELADALDHDWPGTARALRTHAAGTRDAATQWLVYVAEALSAGRSYDGPRDFVLQHVRNSKKRENLTRLLADAGVEAEALEALGISRNPYIGVGGPLILKQGQSTIDWTGWPGPHDIRLAATADISLDVAPGTRTLAVVENRQACEAVCDAHPELALIWCHGQPPPRVLTLIAQAAAQVRAVLVCPDADLGGVRIASRITAALPTDAGVDVVDVGAVDHIPGEPFGDLARGQLTVHARRDDRVGDLARACLARGYSVEQEAPVRAALLAALTRLPA